MSFNILDSVSIQELNMDVDPVSTMFELDHNDDEMRDCSLDVSIHRPKSSSMSSSICVKIVDSGIYFYLFTLFYFYFFRTTQVRVYLSCYHISHKVDGVVTRLITGLERME